MLWYRKPGVTWSKCLFTFDQNPDLLLAWNRALLSPDCIHRWEFWCEARGLLGNSGCWSKYTPHPQRLWRRWRSLTEGSLYSKEAFPPELHSSSDNRKLRSNLENNYSVFVGDMIAERGKCRSGGGIVTILSQTWNKVNQQFKTHYKSDIFSQPFVRLVGFKRGILFFPFFSCKIFFWQFHLFAINLWWM